MDHLLGGALGAILAFVFSLPAIFLEYTSGGTVQEPPLVMNVKTIFGYTLKRREVFLVGLLIHIVMGFLFAFSYVLFVEREWLFAGYAPYTFFSLLVYSVMSWLAANLLVYPVLGMGFFAKKEGSRVWLETLLAHLLLGVSIWLLVHYYQPSYFMPTL